MNYCFVDYRILPDEEKKLRSLNVNIIKVPRCQNLYPAIDGHPDIQLNILDNNTVLVQKDMSANFIAELKNLGLNPVFSDKSLSSKYPEDIILNAVNLKDTFIHNINFTDKMLLKYIEHKRLINVTQGYTKCSCAIVSDKAIITSDIKIHNELIAKDFDVLLLPPGHIDLPGLNYGFIGGTCGLLSKKEIIFYGNLKNYKYGELVLSFLDKYQVKPIFLSDTPLVDRGSLMFFSA
ncbi:DUF6873 family GME fold protein [Clostridium folliculivorans]|uniref:DUF6873 domain-containing protein n=1 Tax=Clostridium folliculivorans TaxID=2886038 RepID=A0A9W5XZT2_9CLOT|nr:hypothetical protein [Clostridium folliculivorans]GKU23922.1 hypothetical protein CFOLD11_07480 [Clostridium folliculivorans]GKU30037.1 hypothetical protein CFB3_21440 [Clostridium folliculivorans]